MKKKLSWENRETDLSELKRYHKFDVMFYRTDLLIHSKRVEALLDTLAPTALKYYSDFNINKSKYISKYHDDHELVLKGGDIPLQYKLMMSEDELSSLEQMELFAVKKISSIYKNPKLGEFKYKEILRHAVLKDCREAQLHSFADKLDGYCEALHEVLAGNVAFLEPIINYNLKTFSVLKEKYPLIKDIFSRKESLFNFPVVDLLHYFDKGNIGAHPHTIPSVEKKTLIPHYEEWKKVTLNTFSNGMDLLTKQVEFHKLSQY